MPSITIREEDNTLYGINTLTNDNIVYVPGNTITGPSENPVLVTSYDQFINTFGQSGVAGSPTFNYATGILLAGMPILFQRITTNGINSSDSLVKSATVPVKNKEKDKTIATINERYGGSYGNSLSVTLMKEADQNAVYLRVYYGAANKQIEAVKLVDIESEMTDEQINAALYNALLTTSFETVTIDIPVIDPPTTAENFTWTPIPESGKTPVAMTGGEDADNTKILETLKMPFGNSSFYSIVTDKYVYDLKFVTSGGYTDQITDTGTTPIAVAMDGLAQARKDCVAIADIPFGAIPPTVDVTKFFSAVDSDYSTAFAPWVYMKLNNRESAWMAPSFVFLTTLAASLKNNPIWYPPAGVGRATVTNAVKTEYEIGGAMLSQWQDSTSTQAINPIMKLRNYGYVIYGQRTLRMPTGSDPTIQSALRSLNVRITANEIKKQIFNACIYLTFEQNIQRTWNEFKAQVEPLLFKMQSNRGLTDYQIIMDTTTISETDLAENRIRGIVRVSIVNAVEYFDIGFELEPSNVTFTGEEL